MKFGYLVDGSDWYGGYGNVYASKRDGGIVVVDEGRGAMPPDGCRWVPARAAPKNVRRAIDPVYKGGAARWWEWINGDWVRLSLTEGASLRHTVGGPCDEGWYRHSVVWTYHDTHIVRTRDTDGADCDGRMSTHSVASCPLSRLAERMQESHCPDGQPVFVPVWERVDSSQRDYSAEAAGY